MKAKYDNCGGRVLEKLVTVDLRLRGKLYVFENVPPSLLPEFAGKVNLIYIDPPFDTGVDFSFTATILDHPDTEGDETTSFAKQPAIIE